VGVSASGDSSSKLARLANAEVSSANDLRSFAINDCLAACGYRGLATCLQCYVSLFIVVVVEREVALGRVTSSSLMRCILRGGWLEKQTLLECLHLVTAAASWHDWQMQR
jgi:hypothetical protein